MQTIDLHFLQHALRMGQRGLGRTWPNPSVGCVLVKNNQVIAAATTAGSGRPHAETQALEIAGAAARGATAYVLLEPCAHIGKTPACAEALINAQVARVVVAAEDPDPRTDGKGIVMLREAGIEVEIIHMPEAINLNRGFFRQVKHDVPYVTMKLATSTDNYMAYAGGAPKWITGETSRRHVHGLRGRMDAVLTGIGTVLADDPRLTARLPGAENPYLVRVVADRNLRLPLDCALVKTARMQPTWVLTTTAALEAAASHATDLSTHGVVFLAAEDEALSPMSMLKTLGSQGITRLLVEAGPALSSSFLKEKCVDTLYWYRAPMMLGNTGAFAIPALDTSVRATARVALGNDTCDIDELESCLPD
jgi:diaminohydroxyphosphoribosylaminopyrimidine deaminase/5-amino-6-(5-phosphoribosylamino)uracil reductase